MPEKRVIERAKKDKELGKSASTQAGEFVREEIHHIREGKHGARNTKQAIAIGLSEARRAGVALPAPKKGRASEATRKKAEQETKAGKSAKKPSPTRSRATREALKREGHEAASPASLAKQARTAATKRTASERSQAAKKAAQTRAKKGS